MRSRHRSAVVLLSALLVALLPGAADAAPRRAASQLVPCSRAAERVVVEASAHLDPSCTYTGGFDVVRSGVVLDCRGAVVRGVGADGVGVDGVGILVTTPADVAMSDVTVRDCRTEGFLNGMRVTRTGFRGLAAGREFDAPLSDVVIEGSTVTASRGSGIFVDGYVQRVTVRGSAVRGAGSVGIYLEAGSRDSVVRGTLLERNGFGENGLAGTRFQLGGTTFRYWGPGREGLAIDGSTGNRVVGNRFVGNSNGGVFLYRNCGEFVRSRPERWFERRSGADGNVVEGNAFEGGPNGVWVGSRMGENTFPMDCSRAAYLEGPVQRIVLDRAVGSVVRRNTFSGVTYGVRVEDDGTMVERNRFSGPDAAHHAVVVGTRWRTEVLGQPVRGTRLVGNDSDIVGNPSPYRWVHGVADLHDAGNRALGRRVSACEGVPIPVPAFIFVLALAVEDPAGPPTPRPDIVAPTLGALPPCGLPSGPGGVR